MLLGQIIALRPASADDAQLLADWYSDPGYLGTFYNVWPETRQRMEARITRERGPAEGLYLIMHRERNEPVGTIGCFNPFSLADLFKGVEIWYQLHPRFRGQGFATQAACLLINHLFDATPTERIQATVMVGNEPSQRVLERAGLQREGVYHKVTFLHGRYVDMYLYAIVREEWQDEASYRGQRRAF